jgi:hypothetical protein
MVDVSALELPSETIDGIIRQMLAAKPDPRIAAIDFGGRTVEEQLQEVMKAYTQGTDVRAIIELLEDNFVMGLLEHLPETVPDVSETLNNVWEHVLGSILTQGRFHSVSSEETLSLPPGIKLADTQHQGAPHEVSPPRVQAPRPPRTIDGRNVDTVRTTGNYL